jgi:Fuc2NAc and GlcNAc transferase
MVPGAFAMSGAAIAVLGLGLAASWWGTRRMLRFALEQSVLDVPSDRSSHTSPTPRGGGLAIVAVVLGGILIATLGGWVRGQVALALVPSGAAIAWVSWLDDRRGVPASLRFVVHLAAAGWVVYCFGPIETIDVGRVIHLGWLGPVLTVLGIAWVSNLFNFMDGIDGMAAGEAVTVGLAAMLLCWRAGDLEPAWLAALIAVAAAGFLPWNWHPARIFMGDVGAVFLGFVLASVGLLTSHRGDVPAMGWAVLLGVFIVDATLTLLRRVARRQRWFAAHRSHAYQRAVQAGLSHGRVSAAVMAINAVLALLVWWAVTRPTGAAVAYPLALLLLLVLYWSVERALPM